MGRKMKKKFSIVFTVTVLLFTQLNASETAADAPSDIMVIANKSVKVDSISKDALRLIFLKRQTVWPDGSRVVAINAKNGSSLRESFIRKMVGMTPSEERYYWEKEKIKSGAKQPPEFGNTLKGVFKLKGSIGYCYRGDYIKGVVKVLTVVD